MASFYTHFCSKSITILVIIGRIINTGKAAFQHNDAKTEKLREKLFEYKFYGWLILSFITYENSVSEIK